MRRTDIKKLEEPYKTEGGENRFFSAIGADLPHANLLSKAILDSLDETHFGIQIFKNIPDHKRILISDYLYQCVTGIESNLSEAKLHYMEMQGYCDQINQRHADLISFQHGQPVAKMPKSEKPIDDLPNAFEKLHIGGFFRAIGSAFDCLGATIIGVLGLPVPLRDASFGKAKGGFKNISPKSPGAKLQREFESFLEAVFDDGKVKDWFDWTMQYRNMFVHRGRRTFFGHFTPRPTLILSMDGRTPIPRTDVESHLSIDPDKSDIEAMVYSKTVILNEIASVTLEGIFRSSRDALEAVCERLLEVWKEREKKHSLIKQPRSQWATDSKMLRFEGYKSSIEPLDMDTIISHPTMMKRFRAASVLDSQRGLWKGTQWVKP